jgi:hypothetical protein
MRQSREQVRETLLCVAACRCRRRARLLIRGRSFRHIVNFRTGRTIFGREQRNEAITAIRRSIVCSRYIATAHL